MDCSSAEAEALMDSSSAEALMDSSSAEALMDCSSAEALMDCSSVEALMDCSSAEALMDSSSAEALMDSSSAEALMDSSSAEAPPCSSPTACTLTPAGPEEQRSSWTAAQQRCLPAAGPPLTAPLGYVSEGTFPSHGLTVYVRCPIFPEGPNRRSHRTGQE
ncbi:hypothetical protein NDU88_008484 [Pleurodeles waltl]|uniref:Uncharacterized protein n=1 Tax=Pleurodeles waltl TaxID=8319 RepID=A0AAV7NZD8_PLEWA|nr:hypothetical protein NDU88_008484 [Pleurodeles waltl]